MKHKSSAALVKNRPRQLGSLTHSQWPKPNWAQLAVVGTALWLLLPERVVAGTSVIAWGSNTYGQTNVPASLTNVVAIASHGDHSLALCGDGRIVGWGNNASGQLNVPADLTNVIAVAGTVQSSLALRADGTVVTWGSNGAGERAVPPGLGNLVAIGAGIYHCLAVRKDGMATGWGDNFNGQAQVPPGLSWVSTVAGGALHSLALRKDGTVVAWGDNTFGQTQVSAGLNNVIAIAAGSYHNLALKSDGTVVAWGRNDLGACTVPQDLTNVVAVAAGDNSSLALKRDGTVAFWGYDYFHLSDRVHGLSNVVAIAAGISHCVALVNDGAPVLVQEPKPQFAYAGEPATFEAVALGEPPLSYQWLLNGASLPAATNASLRLEAAQTADAGTYTVTVSNSRGSITSFGSGLTVLPTPGMPFVASPPCDVQAAPGSSAMFAVEAGGAAPLAYQWFFNETNALAGATNAVLQLANLQQAQAGRYCVEIRNAAGAIRSPGAALSLVKDVAWVFRTDRYVFSSPAIAPDGTLYIGSGDGRVYALTPQGTRRWAFTTGAEVQSSPAVGPDGTIYVGSGDHYLYALNPDGTQKWRFQTGDFIMSSPTLGADQTIYINSRDGKLYAVNPDGTEKWHYATGEYYNDMPAVIGPHAAIFIGTGGKVHALHRNGHKLWDFAVNGANLSVVIGPNGVVYATSAGFGMKMVALTYKGQKLWEFPFGSPTAMLNPAYPAIGPDGTIYIATADSYLYALRPDGTQKWKAPVMRAQSSPALSSDGKIYLNSDWDFRLFCYDTNGVFQWEHFLGGNGASGLMSSFPTLLGGVLYFGSGNGQVYAFNTAGELAVGGWPAFGRDVRHSGRDLQRCIELTLPRDTATEELKLVVEPNRPYRLQGSTNLITWSDCLSFQSTNALMTLPRPKAFSFFRLASP